MFNIKKTTFNLFILSLFFIYPGEVGTFLGSRNGIFLVFFMLFIILNMYIKDNSIYLENRNFIYIIFIVFIIKILFFSIYGIYFFDIESNLISIKMVFILIFFLLVHSILGLKKIIEGIIYFVIINLILSSIGLFIAPLIEPIQVLTAYDGRVINNYIVTFSKAGYTLGDVTIVRPSGFLDEPGQLAFLAMHIHFINNYFLKKQGLNKIIIIGGILTTSLSFIIYITIYSMLTLTSKLDIIKKIYFLLIISIFVVISTIWYQNTDSYIKIGVEKLIVDRLSFSSDDDKIFEGDNRSKLILGDMEILSNNSLWGVGNEEFLKYGHGSNIIKWGAIYGLIVYFILLLPFIIIILNLLRNREIFYLLNFLLILLFYIQRASFTTPIYLIIAIVMLYITSRREKSVNKYSYN